MANLLPAIDREIDSAIDRLGPSAGSAKEVARRFIRSLRGRKLENHMSSVPLLIHAAETGSPGPAAPVAAIHILWWTSACFLDDLIDESPAAAAGDLNRGEALLASHLSGHVLPARVIDAMDVPDETRALVASDFATGWADAIEGELHDIHGDIVTATPESVISAYRGKGGATYAMAAAMAARLAGASGERIELWREFAINFGVLRQIVNDQNDLVTGRDEDFVNGTVTYQLAHLTDGASDSERHRIFELHSEAVKLPAARLELRRLLVGSELLRRYYRSVDGIRDESYRLLDALGADNPYSVALRSLVDESAAPLLRAEEPSQV